MKPPRRPDRLDSRSDFARMIELAQGGDDLALGDLLQDCRDYLLLVANEELDADLREKIGASDVVQETLCTAQAAIGQFQGTERTDFLAWLRGILRNDLRHVVRHYKGAQKRQIRREQAIDASPQYKLGMRDRNHTPSTRASLREEAEILDVALESLSVEHRQVLQLRNWKKLSFAEIGQEMDRSEDAARKLWARAVAQLKRAMDKSSGE